MQEVEEVDALLMEAQGETHGVESDDMKEETSLDVDEGELLVLTRLLYTQDTPYQKAQREMIFHSQCTI